MKRLILKFKHWLIKKLGGYTKQHIDNRRVDMHSHQLHPVVLRTEMQVDMFVRSEVSFDVIKAEIACQLAHKIVEDKLYAMECRDDPVPNKRTYRAEVFLIDPHEAAMCSLTQR